MIRFLKLLFLFKGRLNRKKFFILVITHIMTLITVVFSFPQTKSQYMYILNCSIIILVIISHISSVFRRCHDVNKSGLTYFTIVKTSPFKDWRMLFTEEGTKEENDYGMPDDNWF
jgi:uncharacterized membrane protein YhaH (DUF805 family)